MADEQILYDLIVHEEWSQEPELLSQVESYFWQYRGSLLKKLWRVTQGSLHYMFDSLKTQFRYQTSFGCPPQHFINLVNNSLSWIVALSLDGSTVAILLDDTIEIRVSEDFSKVISKCKVTKDKFPQWRKLVWNEDSTLLSYSNSFGDVLIFDITGCQKCSIPPPNSTGLNVPGTLSLAVAYLDFEKEEVKNDESNWMLYVCTYQGLFNCYSINDGNCKHLWDFSFLSYHPYGVATLVYDERNNLFLAAGNYGKEPINSEEDGCHGSQCSISAWRLLNDTPYLTLVEDQGKALKKVSGKERLKNIMFWRNKEHETLKTGIFKMHLSSDGRMLVTLHINGRICLWNVPSMRLAKTWSKSEQPDSSESREGFGSDQHKKKEDLSKTPNVVDLSWWSNQELILAAGNGCVTISSCETLLNLLGESPEKFDAWPSLSSVHDGSVLVLECEKRLSDPSDKTSKSKPKKWLAENEDDEEEMDSIRYRFKELTKQTLYFITEDERFLPAIKPPRILTNVYRLVCLKSTTPEELYARKINLEHYGDALDLAKRFNLNTDLVYQRQWRSKCVTKITIHDYLTKIKDRDWVLDECALRIPEDFDSTEQLLKYGLLGTSWEVLHRIDDDNAKELPFNVKPETLDHHDEDGDIPEKIFNGILSPKQLRLCKYRWQLLQYLDRLSTYEVILGGSFKARDKFSKEYFSKFRACNIVHHAVECARDEDSYSLEHIFSYHGKQVLPFWLPILSSFPETAEIRDYEPVIPEIGELPDEPEIFPWLEKHHREPDWVEQPKIMKQIQKEANECEDDEELGEFIFEAQPELVRYKNCQSKDVLTEWLIERVHNIDQMSGQIDKCCALLDVGIKRGLKKSLGKLHQELLTWQTIVYNVGIDSSHMSAKEFIELPESSKIKMLMYKSTEDTFVRDFQTFLLPFLQRVGKKNPQKRQNLLHEFMVNIAKSDLTCCLKLFAKCSPELKEPVLADIGEVMKIAIDCIYACKRDDQLEHALSIVECLPTREEGVISSQIEDLHVKLDELELILSGAEILQFYSNPQTVLYISQMRTDPKSIKETLKLLIKNVVSKGKVVQSKEMNKLLEHLIKLSKDLFTCCDVKLCHQMFVEGLLQSGCKENISLAVEVLTTSKLGGIMSKKEHHLTSALYALKYDVSVNVVLEAAKEYFNAAASLNDSSMELAKSCLALITDMHDAIQSECDLINSLHLIQEFNVTILPLQVRLCADKLEIIDMCLQGKDSNYKKQDQLLLISNLLQICGQDVHERKGQVLAKIAESAFDHEDYPYAGITCVQLMEDNFSSAWEICRKLGECNKYMNYTIRQNLLSFALTYCPVHHIEEILNEKTLLETQILYEKLSVHVKTDIENDEEDESSIDSQKSASILRKTKTTTKKLLSSVTDTKWLGHAMRWATLSDSIHGSAESDRVVKEDGLKEFQHQLFYQSLEKENEVDNTRQINHFWETLKSSSDEKKLFNQLLLRSQKLSERRSEGTIAEDTDDALSSLATFAYSEDSNLCLAYMMALSSGSAVQSLMGKQRNNSFTFLFTAYYCALQLYVKNNKLDLNKQADLYHINPKELLVYILTWIGRDEAIVEDETLRFLLSNMNKLQDLVQAKMLQGLDKGVDVERFAVDDEYKRETILGLAMSPEDELMNTSLLLADKYDIPTWEVMLSHVEFLFTDSGLKAKAIRESLNKWSVDSYLKEHGDEVFERLKKYVYPEICGKDHNALLLFYVFLLNCSSSTKILEGAITLDTHVRLLKKIKSAAALDYKKLVHGDAPLDVIKECVDENNVHVLAKIACKIPQKDGTYLSANKIFLAHMVRMFWKKPEGKNWVNHFEACQSFLNKLEISDLVAFADSITFTEEAYASLSQDVRSDITNRLIKYVRKQKGQDEEKMKAEDGFENLMAIYERVLQHLQDSLSHLKNLQEPVYLQLKQSTSGQRQNFAKRYDLSKGEISVLNLIFRDMFTSLEPPTLIEKLFNLRKGTVEIKKTFSDALKALLRGVQETRDLTTFTEFTKIVEKYNKVDGGTLVAPNDILDVVRPFCSDVTVDTEIKSSILHILQASFHLANDDVILLMFYQSQAVIKATWSLEITEEDVENDENRLKLFNKLLGMISNSEHTCAMEQLLSSWPLLHGNSDNIETLPWVQLILKKIELQDYVIMSTLRHARAQSELNDKAYDIISKKLNDCSEQLLSYKVVLTSGSEQCLQRLFDELREHQNEADSDTVGKIDEEFVNILLETKTIHRIVDTFLYAQVTNHILQNLDNIDVIDQSISQLHSNGFHGEAGFIYMKSRQLHSSLFTISNALDILSWKFKC